MNDQIKELAEQAGEWYMANSKEFPSPREWNEKFAELIVAECAGFLRDTLDDHFAAEQLEEHFGVEESQGWICPKCGTDRTKEVCPKGHMAAVTGDCPMTAEAQ